MFCPTQAPSVGRYNIFTIYFPRHFRRIYINSYVYGAACRKFSGFGHIHRIVLAYVFIVIFCSPQAEIFWVIYFQCIFEMYFRRFCTNSYAYCAACRIVLGVEAVRRKKIGLYIPYIFWGELPGKFGSYILISGILGKIYTIYSIYDSTSTLTNISRK